MTSTVPADHTSADDRDRPDATRIAAGRRPRDMAIALLVLLVPILLVFGFHRVFLDGGEPAVVDPAPVVADDRTAGLFPVAEPVGLGAEWRPVSASFRRADGGATLRLGYLSPSDGGVQLVQSTVPTEQLLPAELGRVMRPEGVVSVDGRQWQRYPARPGEHALVLLAPDRTVIAVGAVSEQELRELVDALDGLG